MFITRLMKLHKLCKPAGDEGSDAGGTGTGDAAAAEAAAAAAAAIAAAIAAAEAAAAAGTKPTDAEAKLLKDAMKYKTRATDLESQLSQVNEKLKSFEGIDVAKARAVLAEQEEAEQRRMVAAGEFDRLTKQMGERHLAEKATLTQQLEERSLATSTLQRQIADLTVGNSFASSKFVSEDLTLTPNKARVIYGSHFEFKDGQIIGFDKPAGASDRTVLVDSVGTALSFEEAMRKIVDADPDKDQLIRSKMKSGSGSTTTKPGKQTEGKQNAQLSSVERIAIGLKALAKQS